MRVLVACEFSGIVREAFKERGHDAWSCDLLPTEIPGNHIQSDIKWVIDDNWDLMIAHPPCTRLCNTAVCWLEKRNLWKEMVAACNFFKKLWFSNIPMICIENPIPHKYAIQQIGFKYHQLIQPWMFGHPESKATCLWLKNLPPLLSTVTELVREQRIHKLPPSQNRSKERSRTYPNIAKAMANQWG